MRKVSQRVMRRSMSINITIVAHTSLQHNRLHADILYNSAKIFFSFSFFPLFFFFPFFLFFHWNMLLPNLLLFAVFSISIVREVGDITTPFQIIILPGGSHLYDVLNQ